MKAGSSEKRGITPDQTIKALDSVGIKINEKDAKEILDFLYFLAKLTVNQHVRNNNGNDK
jgi:hypothetical protein